MTDATVDLPLQSRPASRNMGEGQVFKGASSKCNQRLSPAHLGVNCHFLKARPFVFRSKWNSIEKSMLFQTNDLEN